jgi:HPt (histidine-containing phosphotransfer) domain-containing protein
MPDTAASDGGIDWSHLMDQFDGDLAVVCEIVEAYACETRENLERLPEKLASGDAEEVRRQAHTLGGTMRTFRVAAAEQLARELEAIAKTGSLEGAGDLVDALLRAANEVLPALDHFVASGGGPARGRT